MGCVLFYKGCQEFERETENVFLEVPTTIECAVVERIVVYELTILEKKVMSIETVNFLHYS